MLKIDIKKIMDIVYDNPEATDINQYRTELILKFNALMESETNAFLDAVADDEVEGTYKSPMETVDPDQLLIELEDDVVELPEIEPPKPSGDLPGSNKVIDF